MSWYELRVCIEAENDDDAREVYAAVERVLEDRLIDNASLLPKA